jgi:hypothetical protein
VTKRRNGYVHGFWRFKKDKFEIVSYEPAKETKPQTHIVTEKSLRELISEYYSAGLFLEGAANAVASSLGKQPPPPSEGYSQDNTPLTGEVLIPQPPPS